MRVVSISYTDVVTNAGTLILYKNTATHKKRIVTNTVYTIQNESPMWFEKYLWVMVSMADLICTLWSASRGLQFPHTPSRASILAFTVLAIACRTCTSCSLSGSSHHHTPARNVLVVDLCLYLLCIDLDLGGDGSRVVLYWPRIERGWKSCGAFVGFIRTHIVLLWLWVTVKAKIEGTAVFCVICSYCTPMSFLHTER